LLAGNAAEHRFKDIYTSVSGVLFMGTPHGGGNGTNPAMFVTNIVKIANIDLKQDLIKDLQKDSNVLFDATRDFCKLVESTRMKVYTLFEGEQTKFGSWPLQKRIWVRSDCVAILV
jgi:hypothetical protein